MGKSVKIPSPLQLIMEISFLAQKTFFHIFMKKMNIKTTGGGENLPKKYEKLSCFKWF